MSESRLAQAPPTPPSAVRPPRVVAPAPADTPVPTGRVEVLEPLRGFAALAVVWFHFTQGGPLLADGSLLKASGTYGWLGVEVFFVISGFIIPYSMYRGRYSWRTDAGRFVAKRVIRLDPPYLATIVLTLGLWHLSAMVPGFRGDPPLTSPAQILAHLGYLNAFLGYPWLSPVFWTLAIEFQFYLLIAVLFPALSARQAWVRVGFLFVLAASALVVPSEHFVFHYAGLFALGAATFQRRCGLLGEGAFLAVLAALSGLLFMALGVLIASVGLACALVIAYVRVPRIRPLAWLGTISYSLYLVHIPIGGRVVNLGVRVADGLATQVAVLALAVGASVVAAAVMYRLLERPAQRWSSSIRYEHPPTDRPA